MVTNKSFLAMLFPRKPIKVIWSFKERIPERQLMKNEAGLIANGGM